MPEPLRAVDAAEADAKADPEGVVVPLTTDDGTLEFLVPHPSMWFEGAVEALVQGRISDWVHHAIDDQAALDLWDSKRKRYGQLEAFLDEWSKRSGETPGKSLPSETSSEESTSSTARTSKP